MVKEFIPDVKTSSSGSLPYFLIGVSLLGFLITLGIIKNKIEYAKLVKKQLSSKTIDLMEDNITKQLTALEKIFGDETIFNTKLIKMLKEQAIEPKELVIDLIRGRGKINPQILPEEIVPLYRKINSLEPKELEKFYYEVNRLKGVELELTNPEQKKEWYEFRKLREDRAKQQVNEIQSRMMKQGRVKELVLRDRAKRAERYKARETPRTGRLASAERTRFRPQHRI